METLKNKERATIKSIAEATKGLTAEQKLKILYICQGMGLANSIYGLKSN